MTRKKQETPQLQLFAPPVEAAPEPLPAYDMEIIEAAPAAPKNYGPIPSGWEDVRPGTRCEIIHVHSPVFAQEIGKVVVVTEVMKDTHSVWARDDGPIKYRKNQRGRIVVALDPTKMKSPYGMKDLRILGSDERK